MIDAPEETALYRIFGDEDALLYIGISKDFGRRWKDEAKDFPWWDEKRWMTVRWYGSRPEAGKAEAAAIKAEKPEYNIAHAGRRLPRMRAFSPSDPDVIYAVTSGLYAQDLRMMGARADWFEANRDRFPDDYDPSVPSQDTAWAYLAFWRASTDPETVPASKATPAELAAYLTKNEGTLANWRLQGKGPRWKKLGGSILYDWGDVYEWCRQQSSRPSRRRSAA